MATVGELLTTLVIDVRRFSTIARYSLETDGEQARLTTERTFVPTRPPSQIDGYFAGFMVQILHTCLRSEWSAKRLTIHVCDPQAIAKETRAQCDVRQTGLSGASFQFPAIWLLKRTDGETRQKLMLGERASDAFLDSFRALVSLHIHRQRLTLRSFAELTGQSQATLKRRLQKAGITYQSELDAQRARVACFQLQASDLSASEIGARVGYPYPPSFIRAFKRWKGVTPQEFRRRVSKGRGAQ